ncbi:MAG TPA: hypothetical protein VF193_01670 [Steroidobacter sp.]
MNANPRTSAASIGAARCARHASALLVLSSLLAIPQALAQEEAVAQGQGGEGEEIPAVLKRTEIDFFYRTSVAPLSCSDIQGRVVSIFRALGAREDVKVDVIGCNPVIGTLAQEPSDAWQIPTDPSMTSDRWRTPSDRWRTSQSRLRNRGVRPEQSAHIRVSMMMPLQVTGKILDEIRKDKARRDLVSRVTGNPAASLDDPIIFPAQRQLVTLSRRTLDLDAYECELLEQMARTAFPKLGIRVVRRGPSCGRDEVSHIPPQMTVEALMPVFPENPQLELAPAEGESETEPGAPAESQTESNDPGSNEPPRGS